VPDLSAAGPAETTVFNHLGQCVADLERSRRFYVELLGFEFDREIKLPDEVASSFLGIEPPVGLTASYLRRGSFVLELMMFDRPNNPPAARRVVNEPGLTHLSLSVEDYEGVLSRVAGYGGQVQRDLGMAAFVRDPDGQLLEILPMSYRRQLDAQRAADAQA
jgi:lactoylglutathione lyase